MGMMTHQTVPDHPEELLHIGLQGEQSQMCHHPTDYAARQWSDMHPQPCQGTRQAMVTGTHFSMHKRVER